MRMEFLIKNNKTSKYKFNKNNKKKISMKAGNGVTLFDSRPIIPHLIWHTTQNCVCRNVRAIFTSITQLTLGNGSMVFVCCAIE